jgi:hypothetical protein
MRAASSSNKLRDGTSRPFEFRVMERLVLRDGTSRTGRIYILINRKKYIEALRSAGRFHGRAASPRTSTALRGRAALPEHFKTQVA